MYIIFDNEIYYPSVVGEYETLEEAKKKFEKHKKNASHAFLAKVIEEYEEED